MNESNQEKKVYNRLQRIANVLLLNASFIDNLGLLNGKMGIAIFFYQFGIYSDNSVYTDYAGELIDEIYEEININTPIDFANGITGIGWGIDYLIKNEFVETGKHEIFEEIDSFVYHKITLGLDYNELQGCLLYQLARFINSNIENSQDDFLKMHTLLCLLHECEKIIIYRKFKEEIPDIVLLSTIQFFVIEVNKAGLFLEKTHKLLDLLPSFIEVANANKKNNQTILSQMSELAWHQLVYPSGIVETDNNSLFLEALRYIDNEDNWNKQLGQLDQENLRLTGLAGLGLGFLKVAKTWSNLRLEKQRAGYKEENGTQLIEKGKSKTKKEEIER